MPCTLVLHGESNRDLATPQPTQSMADANMTTLKCRHQTAHELVPVPVLVYCVLCVHREGMLVAVSVDCQMARVPVYVLFVGCFVVDALGWFVILWVPRLMSFAAMPGLCCFVHVALELVHQPTNR